MKMINDFLKKYSIDLASESKLKLLVIYAFAIFCVFFVINYLFNPIFAGWVSGFVLGYSIGFIVSWKYGRKIKVFIKG